MNERLNGARRAHRTLGVLGVIGLLAAAPVRAQPSGQPLPEDYVRPAPVQTGHAPSMEVSEMSRAVRVFDVHFSTGDEILSGLTELAERNGITSGYITGLGGLSTGLLGWGDPSNGAFKKIPIDRKAELVSMNGQISMRDGKPYVHIHAVVGFSDGSTKAGHMLEAIVAPIAEITVVATGSAP